MPKTKIVIARSVDKSFEKVEDKFRSDCRIPNSLLNVKDFKVKVNATTPTGKQVRVDQFITINQETKSIEMRTVSDQVTSIGYYNFLAHGEDTLLEYVESASGTTSKLRTLNYLMFELPLLNSSTKRRMKRKLENIKNYVEGIRL